MDSLSSKTGVDAIKGAELDDPSRGRVLHPERHAERHPERHAEHGLHAERDIAKLRVLQSDIDSIPR